MFGAWTCAIIIIIFPHVVKRGEGFQQRGRPED